MSIDEATMLVCEMRAPEVRGIPKAECGRRRVCWICASPLEGRRQFWCSDECVRTWTTNHEWSAASAAAVARDGGCVRCGAARTEVLVCASDGEPWPCQVYRSYSEAWAAYRRGGPLPAVQGTYHVQEVDRRASVLLEVNHIVPRNGAGYDQGCHHHLDLLETLCHGCHVVETTRQIRERRGLHPDGPPRSRFAAPMELWSS